MLLKFYSVLLLLLLFINFIIWQEFDWGAIMADSRLKTILGHINGKDEVSRLSCNIFPIWNILINCFEGNWIEVHAGQSAAISWTEKVLWEKWIHCHSKTCWRTVAGCLCGKIPCTVWPSPSLERNNHDEGCFSRQNEKHLRRKVI